MLIVSSAVPFEVHFYRYEFVHVVHFVDFDMRIGKGNRSLAPSLSAIPHSILDHSFVATWLERYLKLNV